MKFYLTAAAFLLLAASCTKEATNVIVPQSNTPVASAFRVSGINDVVFTKTPFGMNNAVSMPLQVIYGNGDPQRITLSLSGTPQGITDSLTSKGGYPDFMSTALFFYSNAANGNYPMILTAAPDSGKSLTYRFSLVVQGDTSCKGYLASRPYSGLSQCNPQGNYNVTISQNGSDTLLLNNFDGQNTNLKVVADCHSGSIMVPFQMVDSFGYAGGGQIATSSTSGSAISLYIMKYTASGGAVGQCSYYYQRN